MKTILNYFLFFQIINISIQVVPLWNFESSAFNLFANEDHHKYNKIDNFKLYEVTIRLEREILKENENIIVRNTLFLNNENFGITDYDDVESFYQNNKKNYLICPKGKFHMHIYDKNTKKPKIVKPDNFPDVDDWNLMCFYQWRHDTMFIAYLGHYIAFYQFNFQEETFKTNTIFNHGLHAFKWKTDGYMNDLDPNMQMFAITRFADYYYLNNYIINAAKEGGIAYQEYNHKRLTELKLYHMATFQIYTFNFYWINYNNISDFEIGGHFDNEQITTDNFNNIKIENYENSPLVFFENMTIVELKFIFSMYFAYYKLKDDKGKLYHGIIEVPRNRVIFHTDEEIIKYIPYLDYAMLAITKKSAYKICVYRDEKDCKRCDDNQFMLDSSKYNFCGIKCNSKYILIPHNICTDICDESIFIIKDDKCGLCKDLGDGNEYKFYNHSGCLKEMPENSIYINEDLKIIDCDNNYKYENGNCIQKCHNNCDKCSMYSTDINNQQCTSCKNETLFLQEGNCVDKCSNNYFLIDKNCEKCDNSCETCNKISNNCTSCKNETLFLQDGNCVENCSNNYFLIDKNCQKCDDSCETCNKISNNCTSCKNETLFLQEGNCVENCSNNYFLIDKICQKCDDSCKTCNKASNNCSSCLYGKYIDKTTETHKCKNCNDNCETCEFSRDNCTTCNQASLFKYLFNSSCYEKCPNNTKLNETINVCEKNKKEKKDDNPNNIPVTLIFFIILVSGLLLLLIFFLFRNKLFLNKKSSDNLLKEIDGI